MYQPHCPELVACSSEMFRHYLQLAFYTPLLPPLFALFFCLLMLWTLLLAFFFTDKLEEECDVGEDAAFDNSCILQEGDNADDPAMIAFKCYPFAVKKARTKWWLR